LPTVTSTYSLTVSSPGSGCVNDSVYTTTITVNPQPSVSPLNNGPVCTGGIANLSSNASGGAGGYNYLWSGPGLSSSTAANPTASPTVTSTYSLTVSSPGAGCVNDSVYTTIITVHPTPSATPGNNGPVCNGGSTNLFALPSGGVGHYLYSWSGPGLSSTTVANPVVTPTITSTYILAINNAAPGCSAVTAYSTTVTVYDEPTASPANSGPVCAGGTVHLVADATGGTGSYRYACCACGYLHLFINSKQRGSRLQLSINIYNIGYSFPGAIGCSFKQWPCMHWRDR